MKEDFITVFKIYFTTIKNILKNLHFRFMPFVTNSTLKVFFRIKEKTEKKHFKKWKTSLVHALNYAEEETYIEQIVH